jgi:hypothetical protein
MELTIKNGALYAVQQTGNNGAWRNRQGPGSADTTEALRTIRTSFGEFAIRSAQVGCYLELIMGRVHRVLGLYATNQAALEALINRRTGFRKWDALETGNVMTPFGAPEQ